MSQSLISKREALIKEFMEKIQIPVTTKECIDYMTQNDLGFASDNKSSILAATFAILTGMEKEGYVTRFKKEGSRDIVWYNLPTIDRNSLKEGSPMRAYVYTNYTAINGKTAAQVLSLMEKSSTDLRNFIGILGERKNVLAMLRGDVTRIALAREMEASGIESETEPTLVEES